MNQILTNAFVDELEKLSMSNAVSNVLYVGAIAAGAGGAAGYATSKEKSRKKKLLAALRGAGLAAAGGAGIVSPTMLARTGLSRLAAKATKLPKAKRLWGKARNQGFWTSRNRAANILEKAERRYTKLMRVPDWLEVHGSIPVGAAAGAYLGVKSGKRKKSKK